MPELAKAYVQIIPSAEGIKGKLKETMGGEAEASGRESGSKFSSAFGAAAKVGLAAIGAAGAAVGKLVKSSVAGFAEFEQLVGGVETLFKDSSDIVQRYAENAYKTAGLSANAYMETVTSFSASLLQSLDGDTAAAASAADMAISDMSDNANKMGSSMESIQNAYQGFAKQNYTMLDNLKLGYGGTKTEMERLITDAEGLNSAFKATRDENGNLAMSFADIVEAIHIVQDDMGITGTTAREAGETISGALGSLSAAWQNLVTGFSNPDADLGALIGNVVTSAETALGNLLPVVVQAIGGIANAISQLAPIIAEKLPGLVQQVLPPLLSAAASLLNGVISALPGLLTVLGSTIPMIVETITSGLFSALPELIPAAISIITTLAESITSALPELIPVAVETILTLVTSLTDPGNIGNMVDAAIAITLALANGLIAALPQLIAQAPVIIENLVTAIVQNVPKLISAAWEVIKTLVSGIVEALPEIGKAAGEIVGTLLKGLADLWTGFVDAGRNIVEGIWSGIEGAWQWFRDKVNGFFKGIVDGVKSSLGIASPSKVFAAIGENMAAGLGVGWDNEMDAVARDINGSLTGLAGADLAIAGSYSFTGAGGRLAGSPGADPADVVSAVFAIGDLIVSAIHEIDPEITLDGEVLSRKIYPAIQAEGKRIGAAMVT